MQGSLVDALSFLLEEISFVHVVLSPCGSALLMGSFHVHVHAMPTQHHVNLGVVLQGRGTHTNTDQAMTNYKLTMMYDRTFSGTRGTRSKEHCPPLTSPYLLSR